MGTGEINMRDTYLDPKETKNRNKRVSLSVEIHSPMAECFHALDSGSRKLGSNLDHVSVILASVPLSIQGYKWAPKSRL